MTTAYPAAAQAFMPRDVLHGAAGWGQGFGGLGGPVPGPAEDKDPAISKVRRGVELAERDVLGAVYVARRPLRGLAHVEEERSGSEALACGVDVGVAHARGVRAGADASPRRMRFQ